MNQEPLAFHPLTPENLSWVESAPKGPFAAQGTPDGYVEAHVPEASLPEGPLPSVAVSEAPHELAPLPGGAPAGPSEALAQHLLAILTRIDACDLHLEDLARVARDRERVLDRLHEENQGLKNRDRERAMLPLLKDLIRLYDDVSRTSAEYTGGDEVSLKAARDWSLYRAAASDILARQGIETYMTTPGDAFDPSRHRAIGAIATYDPTLDKRIARVLKPGFATDLQVIRAAEVEVFRLTAAPTAPAH